MKLISLRVEGFGPFYKPLEIDFAELQFFCITGDNGSGKSTLVDAISVALWGESLKLEKNQKHIKNFIPQDVSFTSLILKFEVEQQLVTIERTYKKTKSKNLDTVVAALSKNLITEDIQKYDGKAVDNFVEKDLKLPKDFIAKTFILSQGNFDSILRSNKDTDRDPILEFKIGDFLERFKEKIKGEKTDLENKTKKIETTLENLKKEEFEGFLSVEDFYKKIEMEKEKLTKVEESHSFIETYLESYFHYCELYLSSQNEVFKKEESLTLLKKESETLTIENQESVKSLTLLKEFFKVYGEPLGDLEEEAREFLAPKVIQNKTSQDKISKDLESISEEIKKLQEKIQLMESRLKENPYLGDAFYQSLIQNGSVDGTLQHLKKSLKEVSLKRDLAKQEIDTFPSLLKKLENQEKDLNQKIEKQEELYKNALKIDLLENLKEGDACPLCQTPLEKKHFHLSPQDSEQQESAKNLLQGLTQEKEKILTTLYSKKGEYKEKQKMLEGFEQEEKSCLKDISDIDNQMKDVFQDLWPFVIKDKLEAESHKKTKRQEQLEEEVRLKELLKQEKDFTLRQKNLLEESKQLSVAQDIIREKYKSILLNYDKAKETLSSMSYSMNDLMKFKRSLKEEEKKLSQELLEYQERVSHLKGQQVQLEKDKNAISKTISNLLSQIEKLVLEMNDFYTKKIILLGDYVTLSVFSSEKFSSREIQQENFLESKFALLKEVKHYINTHQQEAVLLKSQYETNLKKFLEKQEAEKNYKSDLLLKQQELSYYLELEKDFQTSGFEKFYFHKILAQITKRANEFFLSQVLEGRYQLSLGKNGYEVMDSHYEGENTRSVQTLSGGERFLLSFALALSFSYFMGDKVGIFFIDEGFGSLDSSNRSLLEELFNAVNQDGSSHQRQIGIITHIQEISDFFDQKILVEKEKRGSTISISY